VIVPIIAALNTGILPPETTTNIQIKPIATIYLNLLFKKRRADTIKLDKIVTL